MGKLTLWAASGLCLLTALPTRTWAQTHNPPTLGIGYSVLREVGDTSAVYRRGWMVDVASAPTSLVSWVAEVAANYRTPAGVRQTLSAYQGGVRLTPITGNLTAFLQVIVGIERYSEPGFHEQGFALQPGGGIGFPFSGRYSVRGQADYRFVRVGAHPIPAAASFKELRAVVGLAIELGR